HDRHARQGTQDAQVLRRVVRHAEAAVGETAPHGDNLDVGAVITDVVADLFEATQRGEVRDGVGEDDLAAQGQAGRQGGHVLFRHAGVDELPGEAPGKINDHAEAQVADHQHDA